MPVGPLGQPPIDRTGDTSNLSPDALSAKAPPSKSAFKGPSQAPAAGSPTELPSPAAIAARLIQDARATRTPADSQTISGALGELVNSLTAQMGMPNLPAEQRDQLAARLADDPVVKSLIG
jgi:hypothetical protein